MGHKVHPYGFRLGVSRTWTAKWYADKEYTASLKEDIGIRTLIWNLSGISDGVVWPKRRRPSPAM